MANNVIATKEVTRRTFTCSFFREDITPLIRLSTSVTGQNLDEFRKTYGHILHMLTSRVDEWALYTLLQFYDPELRCFTFPDYQLAPTLEEYADILKIKVQHRIPFVCVPEKPKMDRIAADALVIEKKWKEFNALLAVIIYGLVLFPNIPNFVDLTAICLFMDQNPVPTLLADTYYAVHSRYGTKGAVGGCLPLLHEWFISHLPKSGPFVTTRDSQKWPQRIMGLTANDIVWYHLGKGIEEVITRCGADPEGLEKVRSAWNSIHTDNRTSLGGKNAVAKQAYTDWVKDRVKERLLPFPKVKPLYEQPPEVLTATVPAEDYTQVQVANIRLREKRQDAEIEYFLVNQKRAELAHEIIKKAIKEAEEKLKQEYREDLKACKLQLEKETKYQLRTMKKKLEDETTQRIAVETQLKGSHLRSARLTEENVKLRNQMANMENAPEKDYLPEYFFSDDEADFPTSLPHQE
ncbi:uncharacterized protein LOC131597516 [Vicia villosa]|uniref:uncharacterized protein LOC131597516 n=1 Tax=Vicia villosa TaxID=3911 RepID=UPI00273CA5C3|nr:uncharacterized protein LOC131597516 [Vicia villosa]